MSAQRQHHEFIARVAPCNLKAPEGFRINFLGILTRKSFYGSSLASSSFTSSDSDDAQVLPPFDEEYFEWIDLFEAVASTKREFVMVELGAGYGKWIVRGAFVARSFDNLPSRLI